MAQTDTETQTTASTQTNTQHAGASIIAPELLSEEAFVSHMKQQEQDKVGVFPKILAAVLGILTTIAVYATQTRKSALKRVQRADAYRNITTSGSDDPVTQLNQIGSVLNEVERLSAARAELEEETRKSVIDFRPEDARPAFVNFWNRMVDWIRQIPEDPKELGDDAGRGQKFLKWWKQGKASEARQWFNQLSEQTWFQSIMGEEGIDTSTENWQQKLRNYFDVKGKEKPNGLFALFGRGLGVVVYAGSEAVKGTGKAAGRVIWNFSSPRQQVEKLDRDIAKSIANEEAEFVLNIQKGIAERGLEDGTLKVGVKDHAVNAGAGIVAGSVVAGVVMGLAKFVKKRQNARREQRYTEQLELQKEIALMHRGIGDEHRTVH